MCKQYYTMLGVRMDVQERDNANGTDYYDEEANVDDAMEVDDNDDDNYMCDPDYDTDVVMPDEDYQADEAAIEQWMKAFMDTWNGYIANAADSAITLIPGYQAMEQAREDGELCKCSGDKAAKEFLEYHMEIVLGK
jgi:hypothetical protein